MPKEKVRLIRPLSAAAFGGKLFLRADALLAALGAKIAGRPVKVALAAAADFQQHDAPSGHDPAHPDRRDKDGKITAIGHEGWSGDLPGGKPGDRSQPDTAALCRCQPHDRDADGDARSAEGNAMRAPGEAPGMMALEIAVDELAESLGMIRSSSAIINDTQVDPENPERPFSQRDAQSNACAPAPSVSAGARAAPSRDRVRDGRWLVGMGVAAAFRNNLNWTKSASARPSRQEGVIVTVETDMTDIGTGSATRSLRRPLPK
jgi:xanthine dehydrogenase YagR molybdenum-binding subunit